MRFKTVEEDIIPILKKEKATRCDDMFLYMNYINNKNANFIMVFGSSNYRNRNNIAPFETVSRCRRKLQEKYAELRPTKEQIENKKKAEKKYKAYAKKTKQQINNNEQLAGQKNIFDYIGKGDKA